MLAKGINCKTDIYAAQDELKKKTKDLGLLESKVLDLNACKRNKLKELEKMRKYAETKGKILSGSKISSSELYAKLERLTSVKLEVSEAESKKEIVMNMKEDLKVVKKSLMTFQGNLEAVAARNKSLGVNFEIAKSALALKSNEVGVFEGKNKESEIENNEITASLKAAQDKLHEVEGDLNLHLKEIEVILNEKAQSEVKNLKLKELSLKLKTENEKTKRDLACAEDQLRLSDDKLETSDGIKSTIAEKNVEIKKLEKEIKVAKRNQITVTKRKDKMFKQFVKNKTLSDSLSADIGVHDQKIIHVQESLGQSEDELVEKTKENLAKIDAIQSMKVDILSASEVAAKLAKEVSTTEAKLESLAANRSTLFSEDKQYAQEFQGLLVCKDREFSEIRARLTEEVAELGRKMDNMSRELKQQERMEAENSKGVDELFASKEKEFCDISKKIVVTKEKVNKMEKQRIEKEAKVVKFKKQLQSLQTRPVPPASAQRSRTPLSSVKSGSVKIPNTISSQQHNSSTSSVSSTNTPAKLASQNAKHSSTSFRQGRTLLPTVPV